MLKIRGGADSGLNGQEQHDYKTPEFLVQKPPWVSHLHPNLPVL